MTVQIIPLCSCKVHIIGTRSDEIVLISDVAHFHELQSSRIRLVGKGKNIEVH